VQGKVVLITGGAKRVGAAICRRLHSAGANIMLHYRVSAGEARLLQAELNHQRKDSVALIRPTYSTPPSCRRWWSRRCRASAASTR
jgi:pteridine reductase